MSAPKHSPTPWVLDDQIDTIRIKSDDGAIVAEIEVGEGPDEAQWSEADAALMVAAPDLLRAALVRVSWGHHDGCKASFGGSRPCDCGHDAIVAAVAKARGGA